MQGIQLKSVYVGLIFSLLAILFSFSMGAVYGLWEDNIKQIIQTDLDRYIEKNPDKNLTVAQIDRVKDKSWEYIKRSHTHAGVMGGIALAICLLLVFIQAPFWMKFTASLMQGIGALGYGLYWLIAGFCAPSKGSIEVSRDSFAFLAEGSAALCLIGVLLTIFLLVRGRKLS